ncbi:hypothetical protein GFS24_05320 [Chitinophaga sp. SYP-B3965]|uniref:hypothetical protein n=1 Tax=Chitinophaga sp. SYP-B3965 TaxID=2663120 RepID=UPI001299BAC4|nr:hypothetical protein [Chitinophaga sp. SYP-B3965]MRG44521.1 hypothetical protein [Chitinophaga sp. SYP-B3965]
MKIFLIHGGIFLTYFIATSLKFVYERSPNPIGHGILLLLCMLMHIAGGIYWIVAHRKTMLKADVIKHVAALLLPILIFFIFSTPIYELLWKWRGD